MRVDQNVLFVNYALVRSGRRQDMRSLVNLIYNRNNSFCSVSDLVENPEDRFSHEEAHSLKLHVSRNKGRSEIYINMNILLVCNYLLEKSENISTGATSNREALKIDF